MKMPQIVSPDEWKAAAQRSSSRRRTPPAPVTRWRRSAAGCRTLEQGYVFEGSSGEASLVDLFEGRRQPIVYHHMLKPDVRDPRRRGPSASS